MRPRVVNEFKFEGVTYVAEDYLIDDPQHQCEHCDLNLGDSKLCLKNECKCGDCGAVYGGGRRIFIAKNISDKDRAAIHERKYVNKVKYLEGEVERLNNKIRGIKRESAQKIDELSSQVAELTQKLNRIKGTYASIHDNVSVVLFREFNDKKL